MRMSDLVAQYITQMLDEQNGSAEIQRNELAGNLGCVPSQINYVLRSRFTPERGYIVESQRGGNGYIRILKISYDMPEDRARHIDKIVGESISDADAKHLLGSLQTRGMINARERLLIEIALRHIEELSQSTFDVSPYKKSVLQADLLKKMLCGLDLA